MLAIQKIPKRTTNLNQIWPLPYLFALTNMEPANNLGLATSGESASSGLHESDNDSDPETRGAQRELQKLHKQRKLATIRAKIEEERCLLDVQRWDNWNTRPKKPTTRVLWSLTVKDVHWCRGRNMREFTTFMTPMEDYLRPYVDCFTAEDTRSPEGLLKCLHP